MSPIHLSVGVGCKPGCLERCPFQPPMPVTIAALGTEGPPAKRSEGRYRFLCPHCKEMLATVNPRNNLAHSFGCNKNLNNIDLLLTMGYDFKSAVSILLRM